MNAKEELLNYVSGISSKLLCATITHDKESDYQPTFNLLLGYTPEDLENFLNSLDFDYNNGYGLQTLFGTVWFSDGIWLERGEYDGSEWWQHCKYPDIPEKLILF